MHAYAFHQYTLMRDALNATGRHIFFSLCGWNPWYAPPDKELHYDGGASVGNSWRIAQDCYDWRTTFNAIQVNARLAAYAGPGGWNDPDMLLGSSPGVANWLRPHQSRTQFSLWCVMAAPLLIGSKMLNLTAFDLETYTNTDAISVNQDPLGIQGRPVVDTCPEGEVPEKGTVPSCHQVWTKPLHNGSTAVAIVNFSPEPKYMHIDFATDLGIDGKAFVRDLWLKHRFPPTNSFATQVLGDGGSVMLLITPLELLPSPSVDTVEQKTQ